ncbi:hypothetical protein [Niastella yeongjuensis]|nr:hypothetical protein [Niastella yeongjuensis]
MRQGIGQSTKQESQKPVKPINALAAAVLKIPFTKPPRLIERTTSAPIEVIKEVFDQLTLCDLTEDLLPNWLQVALINTQSPYSNGNGRKVLCEFYELLITYVSKLYIMEKSQQFANPSSLFTDFFQQCPIDYVRRELADFLEAGVGYNGAYPNGFTPWQAWMTYNHVLCLIEASYQLYSNQHMQAVTIRLYSPKKHDFV